jgi:phosphotransferase system  glucose/maltose/N-acetylglucosamine-specific IIC component
MKFTNWQTTVAGLLGAIAVNLIPLLQGAWTWNQLYVGIALAVLGFFAKDYNTTGNGVDATKKGD